MTPVIVGGIVLLLLLARRGEAGEILSGGNGGGGGGSGGFTEPFPAVLPGRPPMQTPDLRTDPRFWMPAPIFTPDPVTGPLLGRPVAPVAIAPGGVSGGAIVYASTPVPGTTYQQPAGGIVAGGSRHAFYSSRDPRVF